jgi:orotate phosphoribosyltransferase
MTSDDVIEIFKDSGALLEGHFTYTSGRHGRYFLQAARVLQDPVTTEKLCKAMADHFRDDGIQMVIGPATGAIILAYETARHLGCRAAFTEKDSDGAMQLRRGFTMEPGTRVLVVEDVVTTGGSVHKTISHIRARKGDVVGVAVLADRSAGEAQFDSRYEALATIQMDSWEPDECLLCEAQIPLIEPDEIIL